jgi:hypothetical protein
MLEQASKLAVISSPFIIFVLVLNSESLCSQSISVAQVPTSFVILTNTKKVWLLGMFAKLQRAFISFVLYAQPSDHMEQLGFHLTDFQYIWYLNVF